MQVNVSYFAMLREAVGRSAETISINESTTVFDLYTDLATKHGIDLSPDLLRFAVNEQFVSSNTLLKSGDHLVVIPPVAGG